ncbi:MAG: hypothetical protein MJA28_05840 [Gammaproteobacteria bacterium]|nr:hypothetical protein [Gammaproteobacteria bacterium]
MELGKKEKTLVLVALHQYMKTLETSLAADNLNEEERADLVNDASLLEIVISTFEEEVNRK